MRDMADQIFSTTNMNDPHIPHLYTEAWRNLNQNYSWRHFRENQGKITGKPSTIHNFECYNLVCGEVTVARLLTGGAYLYSPTEES